METFFGLLFFIAIVYGYLRFKKWLVNARLKQIARHEIFIEDYKEKLREEEEKNNSN